MFTIALLLACWLAYIGVSAGQSALAAVGTGVALLLVGSRFGLRAHRRRLAGAPPIPTGDRGSPLDPELLRGAIRLCHPDAHPPDREDLANAVTARLLALERQHR